MREEGNEVVTVKLNPEEMDLQTLKRTGAGTKTLVIFNLKGLTEGYLVGVKCVHGCGEINIKYASSCTPVNNDMHIDPAVIPLGMVGESFGREAISSVRVADAIMITEIDLIADSPHKFVQEFIQFWGPEVLT